jgi:hypothetical protein
MLIVVETLRREKIIIRFAKAVTPFIVQNS